MQPLNLSYLNTNGILGYDANSYLMGGANVSPMGNPLNPAAQQPDSFTKSQKTTNTVKKVAVGVALAALAAVGFSKCSKGVSSLKNYLNNSTNYASVKNFWHKASDFVCKKSDAFVKFLKA